MKLTPSERSGTLSRACTGNPDLYADVLSVLQTMIVSGDGRRIRAVAPRVRAPPAADANLDPEGAIGKH